MKPTGLLAVACAAMLTVACNNPSRNAETRTTDNGSAVGTSVRRSIHHSVAATRSFVDEVTYAGNAEVELGRLAADRAASP
jgi:hypothetical protein